MKVLLTGATGLVGSAALREVLARGHEVIAVGHARVPELPPAAAAQKKALGVQCDLTDESALHRLVFDYYPDAIVHTAAASSPATVDQDPVLAEKLNVALPRRLAQFSHHLSARFLHLSTDLVFDGEHGPYRSTDVPMPRTLYGQLKLMAEKEILRYAKESVVVLRITLVNGNSPSGKRSLHEKLFHEWAAGKTTPLFTDEFRQPVSAINVAEVLAELLDRPNLHGIFHWAGPDVLSRYEIGQALIKHFALPENLISPAKIEDAPDAAQRVRRLELVLPPLLGKLTTRPRAFEQQLEELVVPPACLEWYQKNRRADVPGAAAPVRRLVQGKDF